MEILWGSIGMSDLAGETGPCCLDVAIQRCGCGVVAVE